jgi:mevalonate kinase
MPAISTTAPGKIILFGEHAVVYGRPAIAVPLEQVQARAVAVANPRARSGEIELQAPDIGLKADLENLPPLHPLATAVKSVLRELGVQNPPAFTLLVSSTIPIAAGLGSGAAISTAVIRTVATFLGQPLPDQRVSELVFEVEKLLHGTPSGIDNTVIAFNQPVYFQRRPTGSQIETFSVGAPISLVIGDTGVRSPTAVAVGDLRKAFEQDPAQFEPLFDRAGEIAVFARELIERGRIAELGPLMDENHHILVKLGVSSIELDALVNAAKRAGALGAKLSGGGRGGNMIALVEPGQEPAVVEVLRQTGAVRTLLTIVRGGK